jgi:ATP-dependent DNA ligase
MCEQLPDRIVLDGELGDRHDDGLDFDSLQMRLHPAKSRIDKLAAETPAEFVAFDCLAIDDRDLRETPFGERPRDPRARARNVRRPLHLSPATTDLSQARDWFERFEGAGFDGLVCKPREDTYHPGKRSMIKVKHARTADCVLAGLPLAQGRQGHGDRIARLGLYNDDGELSRSASPRASARRDGRSSWRSSRRCARTSAIIPGPVGPRWRTTSARRSRA